MANTYRYRYGDTMPEALTYNTSNPIYIGDCVANVSGLISAANFTWQSAIADPASAPTGTDSGGAVSPGIAVGTYKVQYTYVTPDGLESGPSALSSGISVTATHGIVISGVALPAGVVAVNWYVTAASGSTGFLAASNNGQTFTLTGLPGSVIQPPAANGLSAFVLTQVAFNKLFCGVAEQYYNGTTTTAIGIGSGAMRVSTAGVFEFDTVASSFNPGDLVGLDNSGSSTLLPQQVALVTNKALAIGRVQNPTFIVVGSVNRVRVQVTATKNSLSRVTF